MGCSLVVLDSFTATVLDDGSVTLNWETAQEINHAGFNLYRREAGTRTIWQPVNNELLASYGMQAQGAVYQFIDTHLPIGHWEYLLEDVELDGDVYRHVEHVTLVQVGTPSAVGISRHSAEAAPITPLWILSTLLLLVTSAGFIYLRRHLNSN